MVLHMHSIRNDRYSITFRRIEKCPIGINQYSHTIELFKKLFYNRNSISGDNLTKLYLNVFQDLMFLKDFKETDNFKSLLFHLSCNVKKSQQNKRQKIIKSQKSSNCRIYMN